MMPNCVGSGIRIMDAYGVKKLSVKDSIPIVNKAAMHSTLVNLSFSLLHTKFSIIVLMITDTAAAYS
jgi:hypothetical protein